MFDDHRNHARQRSRVALSAAFLLSVGVLLTGCTSSPPRSDVSSPVATVSGSGIPATGVGTTSAAVTSRPPATGSGDAPAYAAALASQIKQTMGDESTPGAVVLVRSKTKGDWTAAFGTRRLGSPDPVTTDDIFRLADITATMTATVILQLQDQGRLKLTDPISKYVPGIPGGGNITLDDLGSYRKGLYSYEGDPAFRAEYAKNPQQTWTPQQLIKVALAHPPEPPATFPGGGGIYSNTNYILLGLVVEKVTGLPASTALQQMLFDPLRLSHIGLSTGIGTLPDPHVNGYAFSPTPLADPILTAAQRQAVAAGTLKAIDRTTENPSWAWTAGAAYGKAADVADYFEAMLSGSLLSEKARTARISDMQAIGADDLDGVQYGFGIARYGQYFLYSGGIPGYHSLVAYDPLTRTTVVVLTNLVRAPDGGSTVSSIFNAVVAAVEPLSQPPGAATPASRAPVSATR